MNAQELIRPASVLLVVAALPLAHVAYAAWVRQDFMSGLRSGVNGTPAFFINGTRYDGMWDLPFLLSAIKSASAAPAEGHRK